MTKPRDDLEDAKRVMEALVRQPPKPHEDMKLGKRLATTKEPEDGPPKKRKLRQHRPK
jgi:hypothetical protein